MEKKGGGRKGGGKKGGKQSSSVSVVEELDGMSTSAPPPIDELVKLKAQQRADRATKLESLISKANR